MTGRARAALLNLGLVLGSVTTGLLLLEVAFRVLEAAHGRGKEDNVQASYSRHDPVLGWAMVPGAQVTYRRREFTVDVAIDAHGLRDRGRPPRPPAGVFRVLALGDSFVEAYTVDEPDGVARRVETELSSTGCPVEVINAGTHGYSTDQEYLWWRERGRALEPDLILLFFYYNDVLYNDMSNYWGSPKPLLGRSEGRVEITNAPVPPPREREPEPDVESPVLRSALVDWVDDRLMGGAPQLWDRLAARGLVAERGRAEPREEWRVFRTGPTPRIDGAWLRTRLVLEALASEAAADGVPVVVVYVPAAFEVDDEAWELTRYIHEMAEGEWDRTLVRQRLGRLGRDLEVPVLDLTEPLRADGGKVYFTYDPHWNARGHHVAGRSLAGMLRQGSWLPSCAR
jgi:hypothetical protein